MAQVTVVVTLYNKERYIEQTIQSVLDQMYQEWELLIINDASTDRSLQRLQRFLADRRIRCITLKKNMGQTNALNYSLTLITTPYFIQLDADDWLDARALAVLIRAAKSNPQAALIYGNHTTYWLDENYRVQNTEQIVLEQYKDKYDLLLKMNYALVPRFYRTDAVREVGGWMAQTNGDMLAEDVQIVLRLAGKYQWIWVNKVLYHRRRDQENWKRFEQTRSVRRKFRYDLYNQILREWGNEYFPKWVILDDSYYLQELTPNSQAMKERIPNYTIVIPNYNKEKTLYRAVKSAAQQSLSPELILIIDDASTDRSLTELKSFSNDPRIRLVHMKTNVGISKALNEALKYITTPYFIQLDGDDWLEPQAAERLVKSLDKRPKAAFSYANHRLWEADAKGKLKCTDHVLQPLFENKYDFLLKLGYMLNPRCYRTDCVRNVQGWLTNDKWEGRYFEDARMVIRLAARYEWVHVPELLHNVTIDRAKSQQKMFYYNHLRKSFYEEMLKHWGDRYEPVWETASTGRILLKGLKPKGG
ncbi:glycosyltransferase family 2 protein [Paenibacillus puldeungensis]|uniref:Glycosyltransferase family 2 protein n=1 Tax=Paenibacillus puldeungensis TaxID=696536 RepID=A0ABW3RUH9_9BACL